MLPVSDRTGCMQRGLPPGSPVNALTSQKTEKVAAAIAGLTYSGHAIRCTMIKMEIQFARVGTRVKKGDGFAEEPGASRC
jgi:hypothetical protein